MNSDDEKIHNTIDVPSSINLDLIGPVYKPQDLSEFKIQTNSSSDILSIEEFKALIGAHSEFSYRPIPNKIVNGQTGDTFKFSSILGIGSFGMVCLYKHKDGNALALKIINIADSFEIEAIERLKGVECGLIGARYLNNNSVDVFFHMPGDKTMQRTFIFILLNAANGSLANFINRFSSTDPKTFAMFIDIFIIILKCVKCLFIKNECYTDVKPENVLISRSGKSQITVTMGDLGSIAKCNLHPTTTSFKIINPEWKNDKKKKVFLDTDDFVDLHNFKQAVMINTFVETFVLMFPKHKQETLDKMIRVIFGQVDAWFVEKIQSKYVSKDFGKWVDDVTKKLFRFVNDMRGRLGDRDDIKNIGGDDSEKRKAKFKTSSGPRRTPSDKLLPKIRGKCQDVKCVPTKICNPKTGRCVLKSGKIGKSLVVSEKGKKGGEDKSPKKKREQRDSQCKNVKCVSSKICNPKTGRCVLKSGKIGKALLK